LSKKNYYLEYTIERNSLSERFGAQYQDPKLASELIERANALVPDAEKVYNSSPDGLSLTIRVKYKSKKDRDTIIKLYEEASVKNKDFRDDHNHLNIEYKIFESDA
tara:strand:- start:317 stop:634 length:318 start_codon:yes stop_codon:yes gene_type:complete